MAEFLLELLSEEIPARMQARAAEDLKRLVCRGLDKAGLTYTDARAFVTPRRLALVVDGLPTKRPDFQSELKGPRVGSPNAAIQGFLKRAGLSSLNQAVIKQVGKSDFYFVQLLQPGDTTISLLSDVIKQAILAMRWPKSMRWSESQFTWVRPLHNILAVFDGKTVEKMLIDEIPNPNESMHANNQTNGNRFLKPDYFVVNDFADYRAKLREAKVILDQDERRRIIADEAVRLAAAEGLVVRDDPALLDEVTGLVEWPVVRLGRIDQAFMDVPPEVLITAMRTHQKYFALTTAEGALAPRFVVVANTETADGGAGIVAGNERVLRARLSDAKYFWDQDRKQALDSRVSKLAERVFHAKLGSDLERTERLQKLAHYLAPFVGADAEFAEWAARLCKADLTTQMVGEFPELQGIMGRYYAIADGVAPEVADAIREHYAPQGPSDRCPSAPTSVAVSLADKIDTLVGFFKEGLRPTGSGDPFGLRRAALGVIRLIIENGLRLHLKAVITAARLNYSSVFDVRGYVEDLPAFFADRLKVHLREQGVRHDLIAAVFAGGGEDDIVRLLARVDALRDFLDTDDGANLLTAYRRASNIVRIEEVKDGVGYEGEADPGLLSEQREVELHQALSEAGGRINRALSEERFREAMAILAGLRPPVDAFFDHVQVNCPDPHLRANRLRLLAQIRSALGGVADFSQIEG